jgi:hypothetical protein
MLIAAYTRPSRLADSAIQLPALREMVGELRVACLLPIKRSMIFLTAKDVSERMHRLTGMKLF